MEIRHPPLSHSELLSPRRRRQSSTPPELARGAPPSDPNNPERLETGFSSRQKPACTAVCCPVKCSHGSARPHPPPLSPTPQPRPTSSIPTSLNIRFLWKSNEPFKSYFFAYNKSICSQYSPVAPPRPHLPPRAPKVYQSPQHQYAPQPSYSQPSYAPAPPPDPCSPSPCASHSVCTAHHYQPVSENQ